MTMTGTTSAFHVMFRPQSLNVQLRKDLDLGVNVVHGCTMPGLTTRHGPLDIVVVRENTEVHRMSRKTFRVSADVAIVLSSPPATGR